MKTKEINKPCENQPAKSGLINRLVGLFRSTPNIDNNDDNLNIHKIIQKEQEEAFSRAPIGSEITLHGVTMMVMRHRRYLKGICCGYASIPTIYPAILCEYKDLNGVIREYELSLSAFHFLPNAQDDEPPTNQ